MFLTKPALLALFGLQHDQPDRRMNGFLGRDASWDSSFDEFKKGNLKGISYAISNKNVENLRAILSECKQRRISAFLVYSPAYHELNDVILNKREIIDIYRKKSNEFGVPFLDYSNSEICKNKANFYNSHHLNKQGAKKFSETLASYLRNKWL